MVNKTRKLLHKLLQIYMYIVYVSDKRNGKFEIYLLVQIYQERDITKVVV